MSVGSALLLGGQALLGAVLAVTGVAKLAGVKSQIEDFERFGYPQWFRLFTGTLELLAALGLLGAFVVAPSFGIGGGLLGAAVLTGAIGTHVRVGDPVSVIAVPAVLLVIALLVSMTHAGIV